jgi:hypothetical protein
MACAEKEQKGATPPLHTDATLQTCGGQCVKQRESQRFTTILEKSETPKPLLIKNKAGHFFRFLGESSRHLHKAIISTSDYESRVMRGGNTRNSPKMSIPLRQQIARAAAPYVPFARCGAGKHEAVGRIRADAQDGLWGSASSSGLLFGPIVKMHMRLVAVLQHESKRCLGNT